MRGDVPPVAQRNSKLVPCQLKYLPWKTFLGRYLFGDNPGGSARRWALAVRSYSRD
jgi:hypothetical protein